MSKINLEDVIKVAKLARLDLPQEEMEIYTEQLEKILSYIAQLEKIDTFGIPPTTRAVEVVNVLREDITNDSKIRDELLDLAPQREGEFFRVPKILS